VPKSIKEPGRVGGWVTRGWGKLTGKVNLKMTFKSRQWLRFAKAGSSRSVRLRNRKHEIQMIGYVAE